MVRQNSLLVEWRNWRQADAFQKLRGHSSGSFFGWLFSGPNRRPRTSPAWISEWIQVFPANIMALVFLDLSLGTQGALGAQLS